jgi:hypothetical protein
MEKFQKPFITDVLHTYFLSSFTVIRYVLYMQRCVVYAVEKASLEKLGIKT